MQLNLRKVDAPSTACMQDPNLVCEPQAMYSERGGIHQVANRRYKILPNVQCTGSLLAATAVLRSAKDTAHGQLDHKTNEGGQRSPSYHLHTLETLMALYICQSNGEDKCAFDLRRDFFIFIFITKCE